MPRRNTRKGIAADDDSLQIVFSDFEREFPERHADGGVREIILRLAVRRGAEAGRHGRTMFVRVGQVGSQIVFIAKLPAPNGWRP